MLGTRSFERIGRRPACAPARAARAHDPYLATDFQVRKFLCENLHPATAGAGAAQLKSRAVPRTHPSSSPLSPVFSLLWLLGRRADTESLGSAFLFFIFSIGCPPSHPRLSCPLVRFRLPLALQAGATLFSETIP